MTKAERQQANWSMKQMSQMLTKMTNSDYETERNRISNEIMKEMEKFYKLADNLEGSN